MYDPIVKIGNAIITVATIQNVSRPSEKSLVVFTNPSGSGKDSIYVSFPSEHETGEAFHLLYEAMVETQAARREAEVLSRIAAAVQAQREKDAQRCGDIFDAYWHRNKGGEQNRAALAAVAQECMDAIKAD